MDHCGILMENGLPCDREVMNGEIYCIFHLPNKQGHQIEEFREAFNGLINNLREKKSELYDFSYFDIPIDLDLGETPTLIFNKAVIRGEINSKVNKEGFFETWLNKIDCQYTVFENKVNFSGVIFKDQVNFSGATFNDAVEFTGDRFEKEVDFSSTIFKGRVFFFENHYKEKASFHFAKFMEETKFVGQTFYKDTDFRFSVFDKDINFGHIIFGKDADYSQIKFNLAVRFYKIYCLGKMEFYSTDFFGGAVFLNYYPQTLVDFTESTFHEQFILKRGKRGLQGLPISDDQYDLKYPFLILQLATFKKPETVVISGFPLSKTSFICFVDYH